MNEKKILTRREVVCITAHHILDTAKSICEKLDSSGTAKDALLAGASLLGEIASLSGLSTLLLIDIDDMIKAEKDE